jgi:hypothetical protein
METLNEDDSSVGVAEFVEVRLVHELMVHPIVAVSASRPHRNHSIDAATRKIG